MSQLTAIEVPDGVPVPPGNVNPNGTIERLVQCNSVGVLLGGSGDGAGGGGDASAANQNTQIARETNIRDAIGAAADAAATSDSGSFSLLAFVKRAAANWTTLLARIPALVSGRMPVDGSGVTQPVSVASLPLPSNAATSGNQTTANTSLGSIDGKLPTPGQKAAAGSISVVLSSDGPFATNFGAAGDSAATSDTGSASFISLVKRGLQNWTTLLARVPALVAGYLPVVLPAITSQTTDISGLAAGSTTFGSWIDLGATRGSAIVIAQKLAGANQGDTVQLQQSDDQSTGHYVHSAVYTAGATLAFSTSTGTAVGVVGRPSMRYVRGLVICLGGGSAQPAGARLLVGVHPGV